MTSHRERYYPESKFGGFTSVDGTIAFYSRVNSLLRPEFTCLDVGCGRGEYAEDPVPFRRELRVLKGKAAKVVGIDVDRRAADNPFIDEFHLLAGAKWPIEDDSIDVAVCDNVMEHVGDVDAFFSEAARVIKRSGYLCIRTPNRFSYVGLLSGLIPNRLHARVLKHAQEQRHEEDVFSTFYRCNTRRTMRRALKRHGFDAAVCAYEAEPAYFNFSRWAYLFGVLHQKYAPASIKTNILAFARREAA